GRKLLSTMPACVVCKNGFQATLCLCFRSFRILEQIFHRATHLFTIMNGKKITFAKQMFAVLPRRGYQRDAAGKSFKDPDRRNAVHCCGILPARNMDRKTRSCICSRHTEIWQVTAVMHSSVAKGAQTIFGIAHSINSDSTVAQFTRGAKKKLGNFCGAFIVSPITDPDEVIFFAYPRKGFEDR